MFMRENQINFLSMLVCFKNIQKHLYLFQSSHDNSDNYLKLESLAARVINPLLGMKGLYVRSEVKEQHADKKTNDRFITSASVVSSVENSPETQGENIKSLVLYKTFQKKFLCMRVCVVIIVSWKCLVMYILNNMPYMPYF